MSSNVSLDMSVPFEDSLYGFDAFEKKLVQLCYIHGDDSIKFVISLDEIYPWLGFARVDACKRVLIKNFTEDVHYKIERQKKSSRTWGGHNAESTYMTIDAFKKLSMLMNTEQKNKVCNFFVRMENAFKEYSEALASTCATSNDLLYTERHRVLLEKYAENKLVYVVRLQSFSDGSSIIKIGKTTNIQQRVQQLACQFKCNPILLEVFECDNIDTFERFVHTHPNIRKYKYNELVNGVATSTECMCVVHDGYNEIINIMKKHVADYNTNLELLRLRIREKELEPDNIKVESLRLSNESLRLSNESLRLSIIEQLVAKVQCPNQLCEMIKLVNQPAPTVSEETTKPQTVSEKDPKIPETPKEPTRQEVLQGPIVQQYDLDKKLVRVYPTITDVTRSIRKSSYSAIKSAAQQRTVYKNSRWFFVDREKHLDPNKSYDIGDTVETQTRRTGFVCVLDKDKTRIERVFRLQKEAAESVGQHVSAVSTAIKHDRVVSDKRFAMWDELDPLMHESYLTVNVLPDEHRNVRGKVIQKLCPTTGSLLETFYSFAELEQRFNASAKTIKSVAQKGILFRGFKWSVSM